MRELIEMTGKKFSRLVVIDRAKNTWDNRTRWNCKCRCGNVTTVRSDQLRSGRTLSCGCLGKNRRKESRTKHGMSGTTFYSIWNNMLSRCRNSNNTAYRRYGGRGIKVCKRWHTFENFKEDMYRSYLVHCIKYGKNYTTIDRIDNNGNYDQRNCRWATREEQANNTVLLRVFIAYRLCDKYLERSKNQNFFARKYNLRTTSINSCLSGRQKTHKGWKFWYEENFWEKNNEGIIYRGHTYN